MCFLLLCFSHSISQTSGTVRLGLTDAIRIAQSQSRDVAIARHSFRSSFWNYNFYKANYLPVLSFNAAPNFNHQINVISLPDGTSKYAEQNQLVSAGGLSVSQNIPWTGGLISLESGIQRLDLFGAYNQTSYMTNPVLLTYQQSVFGYNSLKWARRIEPLKYEAAKKEYIESLELVAASTVEKFFDVAVAQQNLINAKVNYANADTLYTIAKGRYNIGTITENEMLQLEVSRLNEESNVLNAQMEVDNTVQQLRSYLGIREDVILQAIIEDKVPDLIIEQHLAVEKASANNPDVTNWEQRRRESESDVAYARSQAGFKASLFARFGLTQTGEDIAEAYRHPRNQQYVELGISIPVADWGKGRGRIEVARSNRDIVLTQTEQEKTDFRLNVIKSVKQFNLQAKKVSVAAKADVTAAHRFDIARKLYLLGQSTVLDLNTAVSEKDLAKKSYMTSLYTFWSLYYLLRCLTLYDFEKKVSLTEGVGSFFNKAGNGF